MVGHAEVQFPFLSFETLGSHNDSNEFRRVTSGAYHMFPDRLKRVQDESGVKNIVMVHVQNYNSPEDFDRLGVLKEMQEAGVKNVLLAQDGDLY